MYSNQIDKHMVIEIIQTKIEKNYSVSEIGLFLQNLHSHYYKSELVFTLMSILCSNEVKPHNIVTFNESSRLYKDVPTSPIHLGNNIKSLYLLGDPIALKHTKFITRMQYAFKILRIIENALYNHHEVVKFHNELDLFYRYSNGFNIPDLIKYIDYHISKEKKLKIDPFVRFKWMDAINELGIKYESIKKLNQGYNTSFFESIASLSKPIVGFFSDVDIFQVLCSERLNGNSTTQITLDLKDLSKNSPMKGTFDADFTIGSFINPFINIVESYIRIKRSGQKHELEMQILAEKLKQAQLETQKKIEQMNKDDLHELYLIERQYQDINKMLSVVQSDNIPLELKNYLMNLKYIIESKKERFKSNLGIEAKIIDIIA